VTGGTGATVAGVDTTGAAVVDGVATGMGGTDDGVAVKGPVTIGRDRGAGLPAACRSVGGGV
jgi:hypothetical protein